MKKAINGLKEFCNMEPDYTCPYCNATWKVFNKNKRYMKLLKDDYDKHIIKCKNKT